MKRVAPFFSLLLVLACSPPSDVASPEVSIAPDELVKREDLYYKKFSTTPFSGNAVEYHDTGQLKSEEIYRNGKLHGFSRQFFYDGELSSSGNYKEGKKDGLHIYVGWVGRATGCCRHEDEYKNGKLHGEARNYSTNGSLVYRAQFKNDQQEGRYESFHGNGQLKARGHYKNDQQEGLEESFYENGQLKRRGNYEGGKPEGPWEYFDEDGNFAKPQTLFLSEWMRSVQRSKKEISKEKGIGNEALHMSSRCAALFTTIGRLNPVLEEKVSEKAVWMFTLALELHEPITQEDKNFVAKTMRSFDEFYTQITNERFISSGSYIKDLDHIDRFTKGDVSLCEQLIEETRKDGSL